jgi:hypothetical protein
MLLLLLLLLCACHLFSSFDNFLRIASPWLIIKSSSLSAAAARKSVALHNNSSGWPLLYYAHIPTVRDNAQAQLFFPLAATAAATVVVV